jgi:hypothetical protein
VVAVEVRNANSTNLIHSGEDCRIVEMAPGGRWGGRFSTRFVRVKYRMVNSPDRIDRSTDHVDMVSDRTVRDIASCSPKTRFRFEFGLLDKLN